MSISSSYKKNHSIYTEMSRIHTLMKAKYNLEKEAKSDINRAKIMEQYLRAFKKAGSKKENSSEPDYELSLNQQAMEQLAKDVGKALKINDYSLFKNEHIWYKESSQAKWGVDDVFEAELFKFLELAVDKATNGQVNTNSGVEVVGSLVGNISEKYLQEFELQGQNLISKTYKHSSLIKKPQFRAGKVDVTSFTADAIAQTEIQPQWSQFIEVFKGAKFTLKNYSSKYNTEVIHLGKSNLYKAMVGSLEEIEFKPEDMIPHVYYHSLEYQKDPKVIDHVMHLRFIYELSGGGLYDSQYNKLSAADFFIYNDPSSNNIWVRSTKEMIANLIDYIGMKENSFNSSIVILKQSFK